MVTHQTKAQNKHVIPQNADCNIIHSLYKIFPTLKDVIPFQPVTAYVIIPLHVFSPKVGQGIGKIGKSQKRFTKYFSFFINQSLFYTHKNKFYTI